VGVGLIVAANAQLGSCSLVSCETVSRVGGSWGEKDGYARAFSNNVLVFLFFSFFVFRFVAKMHLFSRFYNYKGEVDFGFNICLVKP
jgi:hypothetical protein